MNVAAVAMANKMARIAWAVLTKGERYRPNALSGLLSGKLATGQRNLRARRRWTNDRSAFCKSDGEYGP